MKDFFRHPVIGIDRILSSGIKWQLLFLLGVIVAAILLFIVIEWLTGSILTIKENDPRNIFVDVYYHFADPGNQYVVEGTWNRFLAFLSGKSAIRLRKPGTKVPYTSSVIIIRLGFQRVTTSFRASTHSLFN